jgi:hypothetical protein
MTDADKLARERIDRALKSGDVRKLPHGLIYEQKRMYERESLWNRIMKNHRSKSR